MPDPRPPVLRPGAVETKTTNGRVNVRRPGVALFGGWRFESGDG